MPGGKNTCPQELKERLAADLLDDQPGDGVVCVAVLPLGARIEIERLLGPHVEDSFESGGEGHERRDEVKRVIVLAVGRAGEQPADRDLIAASTIFTVRIWLDTGKTANYVHLRAIFPLQKDPKT
jgi:hypothetical protein